MKHIKNCITQEEFTSIQTNDSTLPIVGGFNNQIYMNSSDKVEKVLDSVLDGAEGTETEETNYIEQIDKILE